jgi:putative membrane protein
MMENQQQNSNRLSLTDYLAIDRNKLANERTLLAYLRTTLTFLVAGVSLIQFFQYQIIVISGYILIPTGILIFVFGYYRYGKMRKSIIQAAEKGLRNYYETKA